MRFAPLSMSFLALAALVSALPAAAGVQRFTAFGPQVGSLRLLAADPHAPATVYAAAGGEGELYKSENGGLSWRFAGFNRGLENPYTVSLVADPDRPGDLWALGDTLHHTTDGGATWETVPGPSLPLGRLTLVPGRPPVLFILGQTGLLRSADSGRSWQQVFVPSDGSLGPLVAGPAAQAGVPFGWLARAADGAILAGGCGITRSSDGGRTWQQTFACSTLGEDPGNDEDDPYRFVTSLVSDPSNPSLVYASIQQAIGSGRPTLSYYAIRSSDGGQTWSQLPFQIFDPVTPHPTRPGTAYARSVGTGGALLRTTDGGVSWQALSHQLDALQRFRLAVDPFHPDVLYAATWERGLLRSTDGGRTWAAVPAAGLDALGRRSLDDVVLHPKAPGWVYVLPTVGGLFGARL